MITSMNILQTIVLSFIEGITEFLPVASTGHLILASKLLGIPATDFTKSFEIFIQLGAIMAVAFMYWRTILTNRKLWMPLGIAFLPTAVVGFTLYPMIKGYLLENTMITTISLFAGGLILIGFERFHLEQSKQLTWQRALVIGVFQSVSVIPGVSRAAATIVGGMVMGLSRKEAVEFSFLLAVPTMAAATGLDLVKNAGSFSQSNISMLLIGFVVSWCTAYLSVKAFLSFVKTNSFTVFGVYRVVLALIFFLTAGVS